MDFFDPRALELFRAHSEPASAPGKPELQTISQGSLKLIAETLDLALIDAMGLALRQNIWPLRFVRNSGLFSAREQADLLAGHAAVIGCGGLGGFEITLLARLGIGRMTVCDPDFFSESNLNRQCLCRETNLGQNKALAAQAELKAIASHLKVRSFTCAASPDNLPEILKGVDIVLDGLDNLKTRQQLLMAAQSCGIPYVYGSLAGLEGFAGVLRAESQNSTNLLASDKEVAKQAEQHLGVPTLTPPCVAVLQCLLAVKVLLGHTEQTNFLYHIDLTVPEIEYLSL